MEGGRKAVGRRQEGGRKEGGGGGEEERKERRKGSGEELKRLLQDNCRIKCSPLEYNQLKRLSN